MNYEPLRHGPLISRAVFLFGLLLLCSAVNSVVAQPPEVAAVEAEPVADTPRTRIALAEDTTRITEPLGEDGYVDYVAALDAWCGAGLPPEENAMVGYLRALGPEVLGHPYREGYYEKLGIEPLPEEGAYFISLSDYLDEQDVSWEEIGEVFDAEMGGWNAEPFDPAPRPHPLIEEWLEVIREPLDTVVSASRHVHSYLPVVTTHPTENLHSALVYGDEVVSRCGYLVSALITRSLHKAMQDDVAGALEDIHAAEVLARHAMNRGTLYATSFTASFESELRVGKARLLSLVELSPAQLAEMREQWETLPAPPSLVEVYDTCERFILLQAFVNMAKEDSTPTGGLDYNLAVRLVNEHVDAVCEAHQRETPREQRLALEELSEQLEADKAQYENPVVMALMLATRLPTEVYAEKVVNELLVVVGPTGGMPWLEERARQFRELQETGLALAQYYAQEGEYPESLDQLVPDFLSQVPTDRLGEGPLKYEPEEAGFRLYSVGHDGRDDGGQLVEQNGGLYYLDDVFLVKRP